MPTAKVLLLAPHLRFGGSAQVTRLLASHLSRSKFDLHLALVTQHEAEEHFDGVTLHALGARRVRTALWPLLGLVRKLQPDLIISGMAHLNFAVLLLRRFFPARTAVVVRQNATISDTLAQGGYSALDLQLFKRLYPSANRVVCQSHAMAEELVRVVGLERDRLVVLHNPIDVQALECAAAWSNFAWRGPGPRLAAVGRLAHEKGFDLLLEAMPEVLPRYPQAELAIAGAGSMKARLQAQCSALGLSHCVQFPGQTGNLYPLLAEANAFVLPSRHDAMPNALLEAAALGLPLIATPASQGLLDLIAGQPGVWIAAQASASALGAVIVQALQTLPAGHRFPHQFLAPFHLEHAIAAYEQLFEELLEARSA